MKIAIIGSTCLQYRMLLHKEKMERRGNVVRLPTFDDISTALPNVEYQIMMQNRKLIEWADRIDIFWNQRTLATLVDVGMAFMARKPLKIIFLETKTLANFLTQYEQKGKPNGKRKETR